MSDVFTNSSYYWHGWKKGYCLPDCWCEAPRFTQMIVEPVNFWTNASYSLMGIFLILMLIKRKQLSWKLSQLDIVYAIMLIFLGFGSGFWHMSLTFWGQWLDNLGMYFITFFLVFHNLYSLKKISLNKFYLFYFLSVAIAGFIILEFQALRRYIFIVSIIIGIAQTFYLYKKHHFKSSLKLFYLTFGLFIFGQIAWLLDRYKIICYPYGFMNGHGIWHIAVGIAAYTLYLFMKDKKPTLIND